MIPLDIATKTDTSDASLMAILWRINYWITYFATWLILPFWQYYLSSGEFTIWRRAERSVISVAKFLLMLVIVGIILLIYMLIYHRGVLSFTYLKSLLITTSHIYSLTMAIWLMVHGLIHLPKTFWADASYTKKLNVLYVKMTELQLRLDDAKFELKDAATKICSLHALFVTNSNAGSQVALLKDVTVRDHIIYLFDKVPEDFKVEQRRSLQSQSSQFYIDSLDVQIQQIDESYLSKLNEQFKWKIWEYQHSKSIFESHLREIVYYEDVINFLNMSDLEIEWRNFSIKWPRWMFLYFWPLVNVFIAGVFALIGVIILESEMLHGTRLSMISWIIRDIGMGKSYLIMVLILILMMSCAMKSLSLVKLFNIYNVEFNSNSDPVSSIFFISYALRLTIPLGYNFITLLNAEMIDNSAFADFVSGNLHLIKIGEFLNDIIPRLVLIPVFLSLFGVWGKLRRTLDGYFLFDYILEEMDMESEDTRNSPTDIEEAALNGDSDRLTRKIQEGRVIAQRYVAKGVIPINDALPRFNGGSNGGRGGSHLLSTALTVLATPIRLISNMIPLRNTFNIDDMDENTAIDGLRRYNLTTGDGDAGIVLESRRNSTTSRGSLFSSFSGISGAYDQDNRVLGDEYVNNIRE